MILSSTDLSLIFLSIPSFSGKGIVHANRFHFAICDGVAQSAAAARVPGKAQASDAVYSLNQDDRREILNAAWQSPTQATLVSQGSLSNALKTTPMPPLQITRVRLTNHALP